MSTTQRKGEQPSQATSAPNIVYVTDEAVYSGAAPAPSLHVSAVCRAFCKLGAGVVLIASTARDGSTSEDVTAPLRRPLRLATFRLQWRILRRLLALGREDTAHAVLYARASQLLVAPVVFAAIRRRPLVVEYNGRLIDETLEVGSSLSRLLARTGVLGLIERQVVSRSTAVVAVSARVKDYLLKRSPQAAAKIYVVPNGVDTSIFAPARDKAEVRRELGIDPSTALIIFVGELLPWQQLQVLLEAMADVLVHRPETELVLLGQGIVERELKATAHDLGISGRARFMGRLLQKDVARWLAASDVAVYLPAAQRGASPLKVYEYLACGLPVVAARTAEIAAQFGDQLQYCESANRQDVSRALLRALGPSTQPSSSPIASSPIVRSWETVAGELLPIVRAAADGAQP